jgi:O-antigen ligase
MIKNILVSRLDLIGIIILLDVAAIGLGFPILILLRFFLYITLIFLSPLQNFKYNNTIVIIFILIFYIFLLTLLNTSNVLVTFDSSLKTNLSLILPIILYNSLVNEQDFLLLSRYFFYALMLSLGIIILSNIFKFGEINYRDSSILFGASGVNIAKNISLYCILSIPYFMSKKNRNIGGYLLYFFAILTIILSTKRSAMLSIIIFLFLFLYVSIKNIKILVLPILIFLTYGFYLFKDIILARLDNRSARFNFSSDELEKEWRLIESFIALKKFDRGDVFVKLFGSETFNEINAFNLRYMFHNDFAVVLASLGLLGLIFYLFLYLFLFKFYLKRLHVTSKLNAIYRLLYISLFFSLIISGISGNFKVLGSTLSTCLMGLLALQKISDNESNNIFRRH